MGTHKQANGRLVDSLFCITCSLENNASSVLHYVIKVTLHHLMLHRFEIHSAYSFITEGATSRRAAHWQLLAAYVSVLLSIVSYVFLSLVWSVSGHFL